jgi:cathepsin L
MKSIIFPFTVFIFNSIEIFCYQTTVEFKSFMQTHNRTYGTKRELFLRNLVWEQNMDYINKFNQEADLGLHTYRLKMNAYGDYLSEEFAVTMYGYNETLRTRYPVKNEHIYRSKTPQALPTSMDWRSMGRVTPVKNQGNCGSCWAFAATGALEGQLAKKYGQLYDLSEQQLVDCAGGYDTYGCEGGFTEQAMVYVRDRNGLSLETNYAYQAEQRACSSNIRGLPFNITSIKNIASGDEKALQAALASVGPVAVAIDASSRSFQFYSSGVYIDRKCKSNMYSLDHAVLVVGYGTDASRGGDYWIVKNSWGTTWGENGYIRMARNRKNQCGIATDAVYPIVA